MPTRPDFNELEAINRMLRAADEDPVNTLDNDGTNDTDLAQTILDERIVQILNEGWAFNTEVLTLSPDNTSKIAISTGILRVDGHGDDYHSKFAIRDGFLYDRDNSTNEFTANVELQVVRWLPFNELPLEARYYIADSAAREYQQTTTNDPNRDARLQEMEEKSKATLMRAIWQETDAVWGISKNSSTYRIRTRRRRDRRR